VAVTKSTTTVVETRRRVIIIYRILRAFTGLSVITVPLPVTRFGNHNTTGVAKSEKLSISSQHRLSALRRRSGGVRRKLTRARCPPRKLISYSNRLVDPRAPVRDALSFSPELKSFHRQLRNAALFRRTTNQATKCTYFIYVIGVIFVHVKMCSGCTTILITRTLTSVEREQVTRDV
jgi:hypothetical protein